MKHQCNREQYPLWFAFISLEPSITMKKLKTSHLMIIMVMLIILSIGATKYWQDMNYPMRPVFVEVVNATQKLIPSVIIEHGNYQLQEKISMVQLRAGEKRIVALNHEPGLGFNIKVNYADGEVTEICGGKSKGYWFYRETIVDVGIYTTPLR
ncbi:MAG: hypothetical protein KAG34_11060 [Cocleimonas sp.]|nr:hypothetical protein [Cocleimonas sp.]